MIYRRLRIPLWLLAVAFLATFVIGSTAGPAVLPDIRPAFRIVTSGVSDVITQDVTPEIARNLHMSHPEGVLITDILYSTLRPGDVILSINGNAVGCERELEEQLAQIGVGQSFIVGVFRDGITQTVTVQNAMEAPLCSTVLPEAVDIRGIRAATLSTHNGVIVEDTQIGTPASDAGLKRGDVILNVDGHPVHTADEFLGFLRQLNNRHAVFNVLHENGQIDVFVIPS